MKNKFLKMAFAGLVLTVSGLANAGLVEWTFEGELDAINSDVLSIDGETINISIAFSDTEAWQLNSSLLYLQSLSHSLSITGANNIIGATPTPYAAHTGSAGAFVESLGSDSSWDVLINGTTLTTAAIPANTDLVPSAGDLLNIDHLQKIPSGVFYSLRDINSVPLYFLINSSISIKEVPEPSTLAILALGLMGLASRRFKKQS